MLMLNREIGKAMLLLISATLSASAMAQDVVWNWSRECKGQRQLNVTIRLEGKVLYQGLLPICPGTRGAADGRVKFHFSSGDLFGGRYRARKTEIIEGDIWQAGGEADALILGVSFATKHQILLNTLHVAKVDMKSNVELDKGLSIITYPVAAR